MLHHYRISRQHNQLPRRVSITLRHAQTQNLSMATANFESPDGTTLHNIVYVLNSQAVLGNMGMYSFGYI